MGVQTPIGGLAHNARNNQDIEKYSMNLDNAKDIARDYSEIRKSFVVQRNSGYVAKPD